MSSVLRPEVVALARRVRNLEKQALRRKQPGLPFSSIDDGALQATDADGNLSMMIGTQFDGTNGSSTLTGPTPPTPTVPLVTERDAGLSVYWDGTFADPDVVAPMDFVRVTIHATPLAEFTTLDPLDQTHMFGSITEATGGERFASLPAGVEHIVHLVCWSASGKFSLPSDGALGTPNDLGAAVQADLDAVNASIAAGDSANATSIDNAVDDYNAKFSDEALARSNADTANSNAINQAISDFNAGLATKSKHTLSSAAPTASDANNAGDVWERKDGAGKIIGRWRGAGGTSGAYTWTAMDLAASYIPQLDIGTGTFGDLDGVRIKATSIGVDKLVVSDFTNFIVDPDMDGKGTWVSPTGTWTYATVSGGSPGDRNGKVLRVSNDGSAKAIRQYFDIPAGTASMTFTGYVRRQTWTATGGTVYFRIYWLDATGAQVSVETSGDVFANNFSGSAWMYREVIAAVPTGAVRGFAYLGSSSALTDGLLDFDNVTLRRRMGGEMIVDGTIKTNNLAADAVDATVVKAGSLGVKQLVVTNFDNLIGDPRFSKPLDDPNGWSSSGSAAELSIVPNSNSSGDGPTLTAGPGTTARFPVWGSAGGILWDVEPGSAFRVRSRFLTTAAEAANIVGISLRWFATDGTYVDTSVLYNATSTAGAWQEVAGTVKCPTTSGKTYHKAYCFLRIGARTGTVKFEQVSATRAGDGNLIVDGAIQAKHITADMVSGLLLSGRVIQTDPAANRGIKISNSGLVGYDSYGNVTTTIDPTTGRITAKGSFSTSMGVNDITITPGDGIGSPAVVSFLNQLGSRYDNTSTAQISCDPYSTTNMWTMTFQGAKSTQAGTRPRIEIVTDNRTSGQVKAEINHHAGGFGGAGGDHSFFIDGNLVLTIDSGHVQSYVGLFDTTYFNSAGATAIWNNNGRITKSGSLRRLKRNIEDMTLEQAQTLYELRPTTGQWIEELEMGDSRWPFFIAEEVAETSGGGIWAAHGGSGEVTGVHYAEITVGLVTLVRDLNERIQALEARVA